MKYTIMAGRRSGKTAPTGREITGVWFDEYQEFVPPPKFRVGKQTTGGWYRVEVNREVFDWIRKECHHKWCLDRSMLDQFNQDWYGGTRILIRPEVLTFLKLQWS